MGGRGWNNTDNVDSVVDWWWLIGLLTFQHIKQWKYNDPKT